jgi:hypothetical protein
MSERRDEESKQSSSFFDSMPCGDMMRKMGGRQEERSCCHCDEMMTRMMPMRCHACGEDGEAGTTPDQGNSNS